MRYWPIVFIAALSVPFVSGQGCLSPPPEPESSILPPSAEMPVLEPVFCGWLFPPAQLVRPLVFPLNGCYHPDRVSGYHFGDWWEGQTCLDDPSVPLLHNGTDFAAVTGDPVYAVRAGKVIYAEPSQKQGGYVALIHEGDKFTTTYTHVLPTVAAGDPVETGEQIATVALVPGQGPHLHFQLRLSRGEPETWLLLRGRLPESACETKKSQAEGRREPSLECSFYTDPEKLDWQCP